MKVPKGWIEGRVGDVIVGLESGVSVNGDDRAFNSDEKAVLKVSAVTYGIFNPKAAKVINSDELSKAKTHPKKGQIIISRSNTEELVGASAYIEEDHSNLYLPDKLWQTIPKKNQNMKWLSYVLASAHSRYSLSNLATGTSGSMKNITKDELLTLKILLPPLQEQRKIAKILAAWDKAISTTEKLISSSKQHKKALMQQLLTGKKRLIDPETGKVFEGEWEEVRLSDICHINPKKADEPENGLVSFIPMDAVSEEAKLLRKDLKTYSEVSKGFTSFIDGDTLIAKITPCFENGKGAKVTGLENKIGFGSTEFHVIRAKGSVCPDFIYLITITSKFRTLGEMNMQGSAGQKRVTTDYLKLYKLQLPSNIKEQQKIAQVLTAADKEIETLEAKLAHLKQEKKALMQQLLTGKRRVEVDTAQKMLTEAV